jgi:hypothetical protein
MKTYSRLTLTFLLLAMVGCGPKDGENTGEVKPVLKVPSKKETQKVTDDFLRELPNATPIPFADNTLHMSVLKPQNREPKRVWMMLPITLDEVNNLMKTLKNADGTFKKGEEISRIIRSQGVISFPLQPGVVPVYEVEKRKNGWYQLPEIGEGNEERYMAVWEFDNPNDPYWKERTHRLHVYEFEDQDGKTAALDVLHPVTHQEVFAVDEKLDVFK